MNILSYSAAIRPLMAIIIAIASLFTALFYDVNIPYKSGGLDMSKYQLTWSDEFDGDELDFSKWDGHFFNHGETVIRRGSYWNTDLCSVKDGNLHIASKYYPDGLNGNGKPGWYTAGIDTSKSFEQKQGYFECRCILPKGYGQWAAFWTFCSGVGLTDHDGEKGAEIDIFESPFYGNDKKIMKNTVESNIHINGYGDKHRHDHVCQAFVAANNPYEEYNTYGLEWNEKEYIFYINGVESGRTEFGVSQVPEWLILSVEIAGNDGVVDETFRGHCINDEDNEMTDFIVDYVRAYSLK